MPFDRYGDWVNVERKPGPSKWKVGDKVYVISSEQTDDYLGDGYITVKDLGRKFRVTGLKCSGYRDFARVGLQSCTGNKHMYVHPKDLDSKNTYVDPWKGAPKCFKDVKNLPLVRSSGYKCHFLLYKDAKDGWWKKHKDPARMYEELSSKLNHGRNPCRSCWTKDTCDNCERKRKFMSAWHSDPIGILNTNHACFAQFTDLMGTMESNIEAGEKLPDRIMVKLRWEDLAYDLTNPDGMDWETICNYFKYMVQGKCLPSYVTLPTMEEYEKDIFFTIKMDKMGPNRLFWYLNVLRTACEHPGIAYLTTHFVEQGNIEPLMAHVLGHICHPGFNGGHSVMEYCDWGRDRSIGSNNQPFPNMKEVIKYTLKVRKLLTEPVERLITEGNFRWKLHRTSHDQGVRFAQTHKSFKESLTFNPHTRTYKEN